MILKLVIHFIILVIWEVFAQVKLPEGKSGCDWECGGISIPFLFGMKSSECYAGKWFEIECRNSSKTFTDNFVSIKSTHTPYLKSIGLEVVTISVDEPMVEIKHPIYRSNCGSKDSPPVNLSLEGSPFVYFQKSNKFVAAGYNIMAFLKLNGSEVSGCMTISDENYKVGDIGKIRLATSDCTGKSCCVSSLPLYLNEYSTEIKSLKENASSHECSYAMIAREDLSFGF
ncbi:hypothetical protein VNO80_29206 [Phaseolus coccineus]|uniref:Wall-associated receptor kinase galacturonan-binding domain-containing protein n=1 Tax=Phaseolus coccineus TaxID=3886 RepID=A0AAN9LDW8_PHACN